MAEIAVAISLLSVAISFGSLYQANKVYRHALRVQGISDKRLFDERRTAAIAAVSRCRNKLEDLSAHHRRAANLASAMSSNPKAQAVIAELESLSVASKNISQSFEVMLISVKEIEFSDETEAEVGAPYTTEAELKIDMATQSVKRIIETLESMN